MKLGFLISILAFAGSICLHARCVGCESVTVEVIDFCFQETGLIKLSHRSHRLAADKQQQSKAAELPWLGHESELWKTWEIRKLDHSLIRCGSTVLSCDLAIQSLVVGQGKVLGKDNCGSANVTGYLESGKRKCLLDRKQSFQFTFGENQVINGRDEGWMKVTVSSRNLLRKPFTRDPVLAGVDGNIPSNATFCYDVPLLAAE
jgi:FKBP-type peptidyl-prolyl cis-trans isomerase